MKAPELLTRQQLYDMVWEEPASALAPKLGLTLRNTKGVDILVTREDLDRSAGIQVKTNRGSKPTWMLTKKAETIADDSVFYAFVRLMDGSVPQSTLCRARSSQNTRPGLMPSGWLHQGAGDGSERTRP